MDRLLDFHLDRRIQVRLRKYVAIHCNADLVVVRHIGLAQIINVRFGLGVNLHHQLLKALDSDKVRRILRQKLRLVRQLSSEQSGHSLVLHAATLL